MFISFSDSSFLFTITEDILSCFAYHCRFGHLNNPLKGYLGSLGIPSGNPQSWDIRSISRLMFDFFNILSREVCNFKLILSASIYSIKDFDSTYYRQYTESWTSCLNSVIEGYQQLPSIVSPRVANPVTVNPCLFVSAQDRIEHVQGRLNTVLVNGNLATLV